MRKRRYRNFRVDPQFGRPAYAESNVHPQLSWEDVRPLLIRGAGVLVLAGCVVGLLSSDLMFARPEPAEASGAIVVQEQVVRQIAPEQQAAQEPETQRVEAEAAAPQQPLMQQAALEATPLPGRIDKETPPEPVSPAPEAAAPEPDVTASARVKTEIAVKPAVTPPAPPLPAEPVNSSTAPESLPELVDPIAAPTAPLSSELAMLTGHSFLLPDAATHQATMVMGLPRLPSARPTPPAKIATARTTKASSTSRRSGKGPSDPPPKCGSKHAKWRYVKGAPTWYCK